MDVVKRFFCWVGWHSFSYEPMDFDGCSVHAMCKWCRGVGKIDSQGNLFSVKHYATPVVQHQEATDDE